VKPTFLTNLEASYAFDMAPGAWMKTAKLSTNITNLGDVKGVSTLVTTSTSGGYQACPIAPRMVAHPPARHVLSRGGTAAARPRPWPQARAPAGGPLLPGNRPLFVSRAQKKKTKTAPRQA
jgi:hypothetical protein